jgi:hypothetical protein
MKASEYRRRLEIKSLLALIFGPTVGAALVGFSQGHMNGLLGALVFVTGMFSISFGISVFVAIQWFVKTTRWPEEKK